MVLRSLFAILFLIAGTLHFVLTPIFVSIMPAYLPSPTLLVQISGVAEMAGGLGLLLRPTRQVAAWGLALLLLAVAPANFNMALHPEHWPRIPVWLLWARIPLQLPLVAWALVYTDCGSKVREELARGSRNGTRKENIV